MSERIGFIGLGNMGRGMAGQLVAKGFDTTVFDLAEAPMEILRQKGAKRAESIPALVAASDIVLTMLPNTPDVQGVVLGDGGLLAAGRPGMMHIDMSTIDPLASKAMAAALAEKGIGWVDAGVGRSPAHAERGEVSFMVGATDADFARAKPILEAMGTTIVQCGGPGAGISMKITLNFLSMATCQLTAETLALGTKLGLKMADMHTIITSGLACNEHFRQYWPTKVLAGDTTPGFAIDLAFKDLSIAVATAAAAGVPVITGSAAREAMGIARSVHGLGKEDITAVLVAASRNAGVETPRL
jgi:4-hydroxybutyrate dehydrogenase/sulfolactaldehyde 3-reductase